MGVLFGFITQQNLWITNLRLFFLLPLGKLKLAYLLHMGYLLASLGEQRDATYRIKKFYVFVNLADAYSAGTSSSTL